MSTRACGRRRGLQGAAWVPMNWPIENEVAIECRGVGYALSGGRALVHGLSLEVRHGETLVLLGRSGSGKTTTLKLINRLLDPTSGEVLVEGRATTAWDPIRLRRHIGYVIQEVGLFPNMTVERNVGIVPELEDWAEERIRARAQELLRLVGLDPAEYAGRRPRELSGGQRQRVGVARALAADPPILLMDEPTRSLDPVTAIGLRDFVTTRLRDGQGKTVLLATHDLREAEVVSDRVAILVRGRVRQIGTVSEVRRWGVRERVFRLEIDPHPGPLVGPYRAIEDGPGEGLRRLVVAVEPGASLHDVLASIVGAGARLRSCSEEQPDLEQAFSRIVSAEADDR